MLKLTPASRCFGHPQPHLLDVFKRENILLTFTSYQALAWC